MTKKIAIILSTLIIISVAAKVYFYFREPEYLPINVRYESLIKNYLKSNVSNIDISDTSDFQGLSFLDSTLSNNEVFLCGESHSIAKNKEIELYLLKYFNQKGNVRYLLTEQGYGTSVLINKYLETGDESYLDIIYSKLEETYSWNKEGYNFWLDLYKYNNQLPEDKKLIVVGADIEHQTLTAYIALNELLPKENAPNSIAKNIEYLRNNCNNSEINDIGFAVELSKDLDTYLEDYKAYLKDNFFDFEFIVNNIINAYKYYHKGTRDDNFRESCINQNFEKIYSHYPKGKYFGQWGSQHTYLSNRKEPYGTNNCFATFLNSGFDPTKGKVISIKYFYKDSKSMTRDKNYGEKKVKEVKTASILDEEAKGDYTLIRFDGEASPFEYKPFLVSYPNGGVTTDYYQFAILIKNSPATRPFGE